MDIERQEKGLAPPAELAQSQVEAETHLQFDQIENGTIQRSSGQPEHAADEEKMVQVAKTTPKKDGDSNIQDLIFGQLGGVDDYLAQKLKEMEDYSDPEDEEVPAHQTQRVVEPLVPSQPKQNFDHVTASQEEHQGIQQNGGSGGMDEDDEFDNNEEE